MRSGASSPSWTYAKKRGREVIKVKVKVKRGKVGVAVGGCEEFG